MPAPTSSNLLTIRQVMERLQVSRNSIYRLLDSGRLARRKLGRLTRITRRSVELVEEDGVRERMGAPRA